MDLAKLTKEELTDEYNRVHDEYLRMIKANTAFEDPEFVSIRQQLDAVLDESKTRRKNKERERGVA